MSKHLSAQNDELTIRLEQQAVVADLGLKALSGMDLPALMEDSVVQLRKVLKIDFTKILELMPNGKYLILRAGMGWDNSIIVNKSTVDIGNNSQAGYTLLSEHPIIVEDLPHDARFNGPPMLKKHNVISGMSCIIYGKDKPYGVLGVHTKTKRTFTKEDVNFLQAVANVLAMAIQRKRYEEELQRSNAQFQALYDSNIIGVLHCDYEGKIFDANDAFLSIVGYSRLDLERNKLNWAKITPPEFKASDDKAIEELRMTGKASPWEKEYIKKDGSQVPVIVGATVIDKEENKILAFALDITERKRLEQRKDEFISIASHELKTPLTSIKGYTQILERIIQEMGDEKAKRYIEKQNTYINRLNTLISDLLDVSKIQAGKLQLKMEDVDISNLMEDSIDSLMAVSSKHDIQFSNGLKRMVRGDRNRLEQVFVNLLSNAIKYSPNADTIRVGMTERDKDVLIEVKDFGIGIAKNKQSKLFERFYRVENSAQQFSGLGIGLYISYEIIKRHGGSIWVESEEHKGSSFFVSLPLDIM